ncbi:MAG: cellulase family glycosylhydrolase [Bacteroidales bacterium]|nr:cellulase family glycosylhydrolase [Bacteroidales bacterium]
MRRKICLLLGFLILATGDLNAQITPHQAAELMRKGINLGNTLEPPDEGGWNNPPAQEYYFDLYKQAGFDVVRIPVRWDEHTGYNAPYTVEKAWMDRVEHVVDWGLERDLFIVLNTHHEEWIKANYSNPEYRARFDSIWSQIAFRFRDKSEKLIFEIINEPYGLTQSQNNELHQRVLSIIRKTNPVRLVVIQGHRWGGSDELITMAVPEDDYLIGSFHSYDPWPFGLEGTGSFGPAEIVALQEKFSSVKAWSDQHNIPVLLGEFGCHRDADYNLRMKHYKTYADLSATHGFIPCAWDDGGNFRIMERQSAGWNEIKDILVHSPLNAPANPKCSIVRDTVIQLQWSNLTNDHDSIVIERRVSLSGFTKYADLSPDANTFLDENQVANRYYYYRVIATYIDSISLYSYPVRIFLEEYIPGERGYYLGSPLDIPGVIEAEYFDLGGEGIAYHDTDPLNMANGLRTDEAVDIYKISDGIYYIGNAFPGEWVEYSVEVERAGKYDLDIYLSALLDGGQFRVDVGETRSDTLESISSGSWLQAVPVTASMNLEAGEQVMRFSVISEPQFQIDRFEFRLNTVSTGPPEPAHDEMSVFRDLRGDIVIRLSPSSKASGIGIYSLSGCLVKRMNMVPGGSVCLGPSELPPGIYIVKAVGKGINSKVIPLFSKILINQNS